MEPRAQPENRRCGAWSQTLTDYDLDHLMAYLRLLHADREGAYWREAARLVLHRDAGADEAAARRCWDTHLARAQWMTTTGYKDLLPTPGRPRTPGDPN